MPPPGRPAPPTAAGPVTVDLGGSWRLGWYDDRRGDRVFRDLPAGAQRDWLAAAVPGEVHRELVSAGLLAPIEPGLGVLAARWVEAATWVYAREFHVADLAWAARQELVFDRLELDAAVYLNGTQVGTHCNAFRPLRVDVRHSLVAGDNLLRVELSGGQHHVQDLPATGFRRSLLQGPTKRQWLRASQSQFGWDWSPRLVTLGITGGVRLELSGSPVRLAYVVPTVALRTDHAAATVTCRVVLASAEPAPVRVTAALAGSSASWDGDAGPGERVVRLSLDVDEPRLWWPHGYGDPALYELAVEVRSAAGVVERVAIPVGLRSIVVDTSPAPDRGTLFRLVVNGVPFFAKGANWVPLSLTPHPVDTALLDRQLDRAVDANMNFLRVWGGGDYETEPFYAGCDRRGIVVWQDFIFACNRYPTRDPAFRAEITAEARHQVRRLARHPSLAVWAGNNENAWLGQQDTFPGPLVPLADGVDRAELRADHAFFETALPELVRDEDPSRYYLPSSPWSPTVPDHNAGHEGDQHVWEVGFDAVDFRRYRDVDARFPDEGGLLGPPSLPAVLSALPEGQRAYGSFAWKTHDNQAATQFAHRPMERLLTDWTGHDVTRLTLAEYVYWTGLLHAEALTEYIDNFRRRCATTGAAVFWMFNDCWPTVRSWSVVDHRARRNPAFAPMRRAFAPVRVSIVDSPDGAVVWGCCDGQRPRTLTLDAGTAGLAGGLRWQSRPVVLPPHGAAALAHIPRPAADPLSFAYVAQLRDGDTVVSRNRLFAAPFRQLHWAPATVDVRRVGADTVAFASDVFVLGVCVDLDGETAASDNFFDLFPGVPVQVTWTDARAPRILHTGNECGYLPPST